MAFKKIHNKFLSLPLRAKFILSFLVVICFGGILTLFFGTRLEHKTVFSLAQDKVKYDLASARMVYNERLFDIRDIQHQGHIMANSKEGRGTTFTVVSPLI